MATGCWPYRLGAEERWSKRIRAVAAAPLGPAVWFTSCWGWGCRVGAVKAAAAPPEEIQEPSWRERGVAADKCQASCVHGEPSNPAHVCPCVLTSVDRCRRESTTSCGSRPSLPLWHCGYFRDISSVLQLADVAMIMVLATGLC